MGGSHRHNHDGDPVDVHDVHVPKGARAVLLTALAVLAVLTAVGLVALWPDQAKVDHVGSGVAYGAPGVTFPHGEILKVDPTCPQEFGPAVDTTGADPSTSGSTGPATPACRLAHVKVTTGQAQGEVVTVPLQGPIASANLAKGDSLQLVRIPAGQGQPVSWSFQGWTARAPWAGTPWRSSWSWLSWPGFGGFSRSSGSGSAGS
jgi:hypothetical protein